MYIPSWNTLLSLFLILHDRSMLAAVWPTFSLSIPLTTTSVLFEILTSTSEGDQGSLATLGTFSPNKLLKDYDIHVKTILKAISELEGVTEAVQTIKINENLHLYLFITKINLAR